MKTCNTCGESKKMSEFYADRRNCDQLQGKCKKCFQGSKSKKEWPKKNIEARRKIAREWGRRNRKTQLIYQAKHRIENPVYAILCNIRSRLCAMVSERSNGGGRTMRLVGLTQRELRLWLELKFQPGMTWDNYGLYGWHVDHIRPCADFNLDDPVQLEECFRFTNLQPLWALDNLEKHAKVAA